MAKSRKKQFQEAESLGSLLEAMKKKKKKKLKLIEGKVEKGEIIRLM